MKKMFLWAVLISLVLGSAAVQGRYQVGDVVDDFTLDDVDGNPVSLYDFQGMVIFINFWSYG